MIRLSFYRGMFVAAMAASICALKIENADEDQLLTQMGSDLEGALDNQLEVDTNAEADAEAEARAEAEIDGEANADTDADIDSDIDIDSDVDSDIDLDSDAEGEGEFFTSMFNKGKELFNKHKGSIMKGVNAIKNRFSPK